MKTFDLSKKYEFTDDLQKNLKILKKKFGSKFLIKTKNFTIPVLLLLKEIRLRKNKYFQLRFDIERIEEKLWPFIINFTESIRTLELGNNAQILHVHKTKEISGTNMVLLILEILKKLNTKQATLGDGTEIDCNGKKISLTLFKLIEKRRGFYENLGFKYDINTDYSKSIFKNEKTLYKFLYKNLDKFKKITISYYENLYKKIIKLIADIIIKQDFESVDIGLKNKSGLELRTKGKKFKFIYKKKKDNRKYLINLIGQINDTLDLFKNTKQIYIYKLMIELFNKDCNKYVLLMNNLIDNNLYFIEYNKTKYEFKKSFIIDFIYMARHNQLTFYFY